MEQSLYQQSLGDKPVMLVAPPNGQRWHRPKAIVAKANAKAWRKLPAFAVECPTASGKTDIVFVAAEVVGVDAEITPDRLNQGCRAEGRRADKFSLGKLSFFAVVLFFFRC